MVTQARERLVGRGILCVVWAAMTLAACGESAQQADERPAEGAEASALELRAQGPLTWGAEELFLLEPDAAMSWLFRIEGAQDVRFALRGFGGPQTLRVQISQWSIEQASWEESAWVKARSDGDQAVEIARSLAPGYYWLVVSGDDAITQPTPYTLHAACEGEGCGQNAPAFTPQPLTQPPRSPQLDADRAAIGLTEDLRRWLEGSRFAGLELARSDLDGGSYGGRMAGDPARPKRDPVIFIHGNSDRAVGGALGGWQRSIEAFRAAGYTTGELYATTWGPASIPAASLQYHSKEHITHVRAFIEAVLEYTGADRVDIITHSMGVTLARRAILGGEAHDLADGGPYQIGPPLTDRVDVFVGIAGANRGLIACALTGPSSPTCGATNGLYPGAYLGPAGRSQLLRTLDAQAGFEGARVYTIWSPDDEVINAVGSGSLIWGEVTSRIAGQAGEVVMEGATHLGARDDSAARQVELVQAP